MGHAPQRLVARLCLLIAIPVLQAQAADQVIPAAEVIERLKELKGANVEITLQDMRGRIIVQWCLVSGSRDDRDRIYFDRDFHMRPGTDESLRRAFWRRRLKRPAFPETKDDETLLRNSRRRFLELERNEQTVLVNGRQYAVIGLRQFDFEKPSTDSRFVFRAVKLDPARDPWQSSRPNKPSPWVIQFGPRDDPDQFHFRLLNSAHYPDVRIFRAIVHDQPEWIYSRKTSSYVRAVIFSVDYIGQGTARGWFELDADGFPFTGYFALGNTIDTKTREAINALRHGHDSRLVVSADSDPMDVVSDDARLLRYRFNHGDRFRVVTSRVVTVSGNVDGKPIEITRQLEEQAMLKIAAVKASATATLVFTPERLLGRNVSKLDGRELRRQSLDVGNAAVPDDPWLRQFDQHGRPFLNVPFGYTATGRGAVLPSTDDRREADYRRFRVVRCGFEIPLLPLFPEAAASPGQSWQTAEDLIDGHRVRIRWTPGETVGEYQTLTGVGSISRLGDTTGRGLRSVPLSASLQFHVRTRIPVKFTLQHSGLQVITNEALSEPIQSITETREWIRVR